MTPPSGPWTPSRLGALPGSYFPRPQTERGAARTSSRRVRWKEHLVFGLTDDIGFALELGGLPNIGGSPKEGTSGCPAEEAFRTQGLMNRGPGGDSVQIGSQSGIWREIDF